MKGILFHPEMIKAITDGQKTQTRRVIKPQPQKPIGTAHDWEWKPAGMLCYDDYFRSHAPNYAPYKVGETVYVKEAHYRYGQWIKNGLTKTGGQRWRFKPLAELRISSIKDVQSFRYYDNPPKEVKPNSYKKEGWFKRSPLFMPQRFARYFITITDVRAERLQEISYEDLTAEGCQTFTSLGKTADMGYERKFVALWDSINKDYPWELNPWDFAYTFKQDKEKMR